MTIKARDRDTTSLFHDKTPVVVTSGPSANALGVVRCFGRRGIPVVYLDSEPGSMVRHSKYISRRLKCPGSGKSEAGFIDALLAFGRQSPGRMVIVPTGDRDVLALSKHKKELAQFYHLPLPGYEVLQKLVNKRQFYKLLAETRTPHPKTYFPQDPAELWSLGKQIGYPYIIKPADSAGFQEEFRLKCFLIESSQQLEKAVGRLEGKDFELMLQEVIPGREIYEFYTYLDDKSEPLAVCGYDKLRQYPPDFGSGSFCRSRWRPSAIEPVMELLQTIRYHGFAEPELKRDPRDGKYKLIEINARTTLQNRLPPSCGLDVEYLAYLAITGQDHAPPAMQKNGVLWTDDFADLASCLILWKRREITVDEMIKFIKARKVHSVAARDDPWPVIACAIAMLRSGFRSLFRPTANRVRGT